MRSRLPKKEVFMANSNEELVEKLLKEDPAFKKTYLAHRGYEKTVAKLEKKARLTAVEEAEKARLKKLKLSLKDEMEKIISMHRQ